MRIHATLEPTGGNNTAFVLTDVQVAALDGGGRPKVAATVNGVTLRTSVARMGGRWLLGVNAARRTEAGISAGDLCEVDIVLDETPRTVEVPDDLAAALASDRARAEVWAGWSFTRQNQAATSLTSAKRPETRASRLAKVLDDLGR